MLVYIGARLIVAGDMTVGAMVAASILSARALAVLRGRAYVLPQDVRELAPDVLRHRIVLSYQALAEEVESDTILQAVLEAVPAPRIELRREVA